MTPATVAYLILIIFVIVAVLLAIDILIKRIMPIGCIVMIIGLILVAFVYTLNH